MTARLRPPEPQQYVGVSPASEPLAHRWDEDAAVTVITPTIRGRFEMLRRAVASVQAQTQPVKHLVIMDAEGDGPAAVRNSGIEVADTEWIAFLDDDDEIYPDHLALLIDYAERSGADLVYPWFDLNRSGQVRNEDDPLRVVSPEGHLVTPMGVPVTATLMEQLTNRNWIPVTLLVRRSAIEAVGGFPTPGTVEWPHQDCEDWGCWIRMRDAGYRFEHIGIRTWVWNHWGGNSSGRADRARAMGQL